MKTAVFLVLTLGAAAALAASKPNILLIVSDDQGYPDLGCIGAKPVGSCKWVESSRGGGLFDLTSDLEEQRDLAGEKPETLQHVKSRFTAWRAGMDAAEPRGPFRDY